MKRTLRLACAAIGIAASAFLAACATQSPPALFDLGPARAASAAPTNVQALPPLCVAEVVAPAWLDTPLMYFRLAYADEQQPRPYAGSRWTMPPGQLFGQRLKAHLAQAGGVVLSEIEAAGRLPLLRIEVDDFTQSFDSARQSHARIALRASAFNGGELIAQKTFMRQSPAPSADATGGAKALREASDSTIKDMLEWLASLPLKK